MGETAGASITISAFDWVPDFARGQVRDLVARWALEEIERPYNTHLINAGAPRGNDYLAWHPFDQVPAYRDETGELFESGAILLHLGRQDERLLPADPATRMLAESWLFAALNSVEPVLRPISLLPLYHAGTDWVGAAMAAQQPMAEKRLQRVAEALGRKDWLAGQFSIADIMMAFVLRSFGGQMINDQPALIAYRDRALARPAFKRALKAQLDDFTGKPPQG